MKKAMCIKHLNKGRGGSNRISSVRQLIKESMHKQHQPQSRYLPKSPQGRGGANRVNSVQEMKKGLTRGWGTHRGALKEEGLDVQKGGIKLKTQIGKRRR